MWTKTSRPSSLVLLQAHKDQVGVSPWEGFELCRHGKGLNCVVIGGVWTVSSWEGFELCHHGRGLNRVIIGGVWTVSSWEGFALGHYGRGLHCVIMGGISIVSPWETLLCVTVGLVWTVAPMVSSWDGFELCHQFCHYGRGLNCVVNGVMGGVWIVLSWERFELCHHGTDFNCVAMGWIWSVSVQVLVWDGFYFQSCHNGTGLNSVTLRWVLIVSLWNGFGLCHLGMAFNWSRDSLLVGAKLMI